MSVHKTIRIKCTDSYVEGSSDEERRSDLPSIPQAGGSVGSLYPQHSHTHSLTSLEGWRASDSTEPIINAN